jgi:hypothetical protein
MTTFALSLLVVYDKIESKWSQIADHYLTSRFLVEVTADPASDAVRL